MKELIEKMREAATLRISKKFEPWIMKLNLSTTIGESGLQDKLKLTQREIERQVELVEPILVECAKIAASHYENKWVSVAEMIPGTVKDADGCDWRYSATVKFKTKHGQEYEGWIRFDFMEWIAKDRGIQFSLSDVVEWHPLPDLPTPPNSDKNVQDKG